MPIIIKIKKIIYHPVFLLSGILILGLILRLVNLGKEPFWGDEILSLSIVKHYQHNFFGLINYLKEVEIHPPLYYIILDFWTRLFGFSQAAVRSLSLIFGLGIIWLVYLSGRIFFPKTSFGLVAALITAILPIQIEFSQEARPYIIYCFFGWLAILMTWQYLKGDHNRLKYLSVYIISVIIGLYLHYSFAIIIAVTLGWWIIDAVISQKDFSKRLLEFFISIFLIFLGFYWWLGNMLYKFSLSQIILFNTRHDIALVRPVNFFETTINNLIWTTKEIDLLPVEIFSVILFKLFLILFFILVIYRQRANLSALFIEHGKKILYFFWLFFLPIIIFLFSPQSKFYAPLTEKHIITASLAAVFIFSMAAIYLKRKELLIFLAVFVLSVINYNVRIIADDSVWDPLFRLNIISGYINENYKTGDIVIDYFNFARSDLNYYLKQEISALGFYPPFLVDNDYLSSRETLGFLENESQFRSLIFNDNEEEIKMRYILNKYQPKRIWMVHFPAGARLFGILERNSFRYAIVSYDRELSPVDLFVKKIPSE